MKPRVLVSCDRYLPGVRGGGPIRSVSALTIALGDEVDFRIVTRDRDVGATAPYPDVISGTWTRRAEVPVLYWAPGQPTLRSWEDAILDVRPDVVYLNSLFSPRFSIAPLLLRRAGSARALRFVVAPRGELYDGALAIHWWKKATYLRLSRSLGLLDGLTWHATSDEEARQIRRWFGARVKVVVAPVLSGTTPSHDEPKRPRKEPGRLEIAFLSRISPKKNLLGAIELLKDLPGDFQLNVYGPTEDKAYWARCCHAIAELPPNVTVHAHGPVESEDVPDVLARHHVFFLPTYGENFGHVILEALLAGLPVLISDQTPWLDLERHGAGWSLPISQPEQFRETLEALARMNEPELARWSRGARQHGLAYVREASAVVRNRDLFASAGQP